jgi:replicative superfamily II helicase
MEKISWTDRVRNEEVLQRVKKEKNILKTIKKKANWIGHVLRRNRFLKHVIEGKIEKRTEVTRRRGTRRKRPLDDFKEKRGYCKLKEEALDNNLRKTRFRTASRGFLCHIICSSK